MSGWIKLWRKSLESGLMQNPELWLFWCYCLMKATHKSCKVMVGWQMVQLEPGQFVFGRKQAAKELPLSERTIRTCLKKLEKLQNLTIKPTNKYSIISIVNWETYQGSDQQADQQTDQHVTSKRPAGDHVQEGKNGKKKNTYPSEFERFWSAYPKKVGKGGAYKAWQKMNGSRPTIEDIEQILERQRNSVEWNKENGQYIPNPQTWLNQARWEDQLTPLKSGSQSNRPEYVH